MPLFAKFFWIAVAGGCGALARYGLTGAVQQWAGPGFPWGTVAANLCGCLLFGILWAMGSERMLISPELRTILLVGFLGAFTTFSTFAAETGRMMADSEWLLACANLAFQNVAGLLMFFAGLSLGRWL